MYRMFWHFIAFRQQSIHLGFTTPINTTTTELPVVTVPAAELQSNGSQQNASADINPTSVLKYESMAQNRTTAQRNHSTIIILPSINLTSFFSAAKDIQSSHMVSHKKVIPSIQPTPVASIQPLTSTKLSDYQHSVAKRNAHDPSNYSKHEHRKRVEVTISIIIHNVSVAMDDFNDAENRNEWTTKNAIRFVWDKSDSFLVERILCFRFAYLIRNVENLQEWFVASDTDAIGKCVQPHGHHLYGAGERQCCAGGNRSRWYGINSRCWSGQRHGESFVHKIWTWVKCNLLRASFPALTTISSIAFCFVFCRTAYLKEPPYATPLIPSDAPTELSAVFGQFMHTPHLLILIGIVLFLLTCLLMVLMLLSVGARPSQSRNLISREVQTSSTILPVSTTRFERGVRSIDEYEENATATAMDASPRTHTANQVATQMTSLHGFDNFGYERDHSFILVPSPPKSHRQNMHHKKVGTPNIYFPSPPSGGSNSVTQSSADSLSDASSIYYIKKPKRERERDRLTDSGRARGRVYATILRKPSNRAKATSHAKLKRKYLKSENRVGTLVETAQIHSSHSDNTRADGVSGDDTFDESKDTNVYERIEAINPFAGNYANQKRRQFVEPTARHERVVAARKRSGTASPVQNYHIVERIGRENDRRNRTTDAEPKSMPIVKNTPKKSSKHRQRTVEASGDNGDAISVGSFLSMASVRSFPKCNVPEPLTRVLSYDEDIEAAEAMNRVPRIVDTKLKNGGPTTMPKQPVDDGHFTYLTRTRSDGADPGVIGPVVWQIHKKQHEAIGKVSSWIHSDPIASNRHFSSAGSLSPLRDPVFERNRYEGLLDGAMNLYKIETTEVHSVETATDTATMREETQRKSIFASKVVNEHWEE